jgi:hypothetical protein
MMLVKELIEKLQQFDPNTLVVCEDPEWGNYDATEIQQVIYKTRDDQRVHHADKAIIGEEMYPSAPTNFPTEISCKLLHYRAVRIR